jgi:adenylate cyclase
VASSVVGAIEPRLRLSEIERASRKPTENLDAYDLHLRARAEYQKYTAESVCEAITLLKRALVIAPSYAPAAAMLALCRHSQRLLGWRSLSAVEVADAVRLARQAIEAGKDDPDTLWMACLTLSALAGEHDTAAAGIDRALMLNPNSAHAWQASGYVSCFRNLPSLAIDAFRRAARLSPLDPFGWSFTGGIAFAHLASGRYEEAIEWADRPLREQPRYSTLYRAKVVSYAHLGRIPEAREALARLLELQPGLTIAKLTLPNLAPELATIHVEGLRKAGMPEE